jgi:hypothetical protein
VGILWLCSRIKLYYMSGKYPYHRTMSTRDISLNKLPLPSKNILNTTLVTQIEVIEDGVVKYYNWDKNAKVVAMMEDTQKTLRIYINHKTK